MTIVIKRIYEKPSPSDGARFLVDRLWPRGVKKEEARLEAWLRDVAPSNELRQWFDHDPVKWPQFQEKYFKELKGLDAALSPLRAAAAKGKVTLLYSVKDEEHNQAVVLKAFLERAGKS